jgi:hypothetical protein
MEDDIVQELDVHEPIRERVKKSLSLFRATHINLFCIRNIADVSNQDIILVLVALTPRRCENTETDLN